MKCKCGSSTFIQKFGSVVHFINNTRITINNVPISICIVCNNKHLDSERLILVLKDAYCRSLQETNLLEYNIELNDIS